MSPTTERRCRRSAHHSTALRYQLESTLSRGHMAALALSDGSGMLLACAGEDLVCEELGAVAPMLALGWPPGSPKRAVQSQDVSVHSLECFGEPLYLASIGGGVTRDALLSHSARGVERILTAS